MSATPQRIVRALQATALAVLVVGIQGALARGGGRGTDDAARAAIVELRPGYEPWTQHWFRPDDSEAAIFALQAALGGLVFASAVLRLRAKRAAE